MVSSIRTVNSSNAQLLCLLFLKTHVIPFIKIKMQFVASKRYKIKEGSHALYYKYSQGFVMQSLGTIDRYKLYINFDKWYYARKIRSYFGIACKGAAREVMVNNRVFLIIAFLVVDLLARFERACVFVRNVS
jgi:hypothetical protein